MKGHTPVGGRLLLAVSLLASCAVGGVASGNHPPSRRFTRLSPVLANSAARSGEHSYIVQFHDPARGLAAAAASGARLARRYETLPMAAVEATPDALARLLASREVRHVSPDLETRRATEFALPAIGVDLAAKTGVSGIGIGVAVIDSGIDSHQDLAVQTTANTVAAAGRAGNGSGKGDGKGDGNGNDGNDDGNDDGSGGGRHGGRGDSSRGPGYVPSRVVVGMDFLQNRYRTLDNDQCGHGTLIAGIIAGNGSASGKLTGARYNTRHFPGVAPRASVINLRVLNRYGRGRTADAIAAIDWCIRFRQRYNIRVINMSFGQAPIESYQIDPLCVAAEKAWNSGIVVVCAAGNRGRKDPNSETGGARYGTINSPGIDPYVITVGATKDAGTPTCGDDWIASYSSRGPTLPDHIVKPDVLAPGNRIISLRGQAFSGLDQKASRTNLIPLSYYWNIAPAAASHRYFRLSGTSMAAAFVSGAVALMLERDPSLTPDSVKARLMLTARRIWRADGKTANLFSRGAGLIDVPTALASTVVADRPSLSPWVERHSAGLLLHPYYGLDGSPTYWQDDSTRDLIWGDGALWGDGTATLVLTRDGASWGDPGTVGSIWGSGALWGDDSAFSVALADARMWQSQNIWGDGALWGDGSTAVVPRQLAWHDGVWADLVRFCITGDNG